MRSLIGSLNINVLIVTVCMMAIIVQSVDITSIMECNMKLITIKFIKSENTYSSEEYVFKADDHFEVEIGDILYDRRYSNPMRVVRVEMHLKEKNFHKDFKLNTLSMANLRERITKSKRYGNRYHLRDMEKRIQVSLEEARNWYNGKDNTLKRLALQVYTEEELKEPQTYYEVLKEMDIDTIKVGIDLRNKSGKNLAPLFRLLNDECNQHARLRVIAEYLNKGWSPTLEGDKCSIGKYLPNSSFEPLLILENRWGIFRHCRVFYPGIVYFKTAEDAKKAFELIKEM